MTDIRAEKLRAVEACILGKAYAYYPGKYREALQLHEIKDPALRDYVAGHAFIAFSQLNRIISHIRTMKVRYTMPKSTMATACFRVSQEGASCVYGYVHSEYEMRDGVPYYDHKLVCNGAALVSQDGECRTRVLTWNRFMSLWKEFDCEKAERVVLARIESGLMDLRVDFYYPEGVPASREYEESFNSARIPALLMILCWVVDYQQVEDGYVENHMDNVYRKIIHRDEERDIVRADIATDLKMQELIVRAAIYPPRIPHTKTIDVFLRVIQKIVPVTVVELREPDNINFAVWREIYISSYVSALALNLATPHVPYFNNWFYIQNARAELYDNPAMHRRYANSELAADISRQLVAANRYNFIGEDPAQRTINNQFSALSKSMRDSLIFTDRNIRLANTAICMTVEYVGRTLRDIMVMVNDPANSASSAMHRAISDRHFEEHIFTYIYTCYAFARNGIIHGDAHINNMTIHNMYAPPPNIDEPGHNVYLANGVVYAVPFMGTYASIIDYSRAVIGNVDKLQTEFGKHFTELYLTAQNDRIMAIVAQYAPEIAAKHRGAIMSGLTANFAAMFHVLSAIDPLIIASNLLAMITTEKKFNDPAPGNTNNRELLRKIVDLSERLILKGLLEFAAGRVPAIDNLPAGVILRECFAKYVCGAGWAGQVEDVYNADRALVWDPSDYEKWGPIMSEDAWLEMMQACDDPDTAAELEDILILRKDYSAQTQEVADRHPAPEWMFE